MIISEHVLSPNFAPTWLRSCWRLIRLRCCSWFCSWACFLFSVDAVTAVCKLSNHVTSLTSQIFQNEKTVLQHNFPHLDNSFTSVLVQFLLLFQLQVPLLSFVSWKIWNHKPLVRGRWKQEVSNTLLSLVVWWSHLLTSVKVALNFSCHDLCSCSFSCRRDATCCCAVESWFCKVITSSPEGLWRK